MSGNRHFQDGKGLDCTARVPVYHEESGRLVRIDKFRTEESIKENARIASAEWKKRNPRGRWAARHPGTAKFRTMFVCVFRKRRGQRWWRSFPKMFFP